eukprot:jgi/Picsp_1/6511/NSC_03855-R1_ubiquitin-like protein
MKLSIKPLNGEKISISVNEDSQVSALKRKVAVEFGIDEVKIKLIFKGQILKDDNMIKDYGFKEQDTIYMMPGNTSGVARSDRVHENGSGGETDFVASDTVTQGPSGLFGSNDSHTSDIMNQILSNNSHLERMMESNPEIRSLFSNPEQLQEMMRVMSNPELRLEYMRNMDRTISNIESIPGGFNALANIMAQSSSPVPCESTAVPAQENPFQRLFRYEEPQLNDNPLPNPWGAQHADSQDPQDGIPGLLDERIMLELQSLLNSPQYREALQVMNNPENRAALMTQMEEVLRNPEMMRNLDDFGTRFGLNSNIREALQTLQRSLDSFGSGPAQGQDLLTPTIEEDIGRKVQLIKEMGFDNEDAIRRALIQSGGDIQGAIDQLLSRF